MSKNKHIGSRFDEFLDSEGFLKHLLLPSNV